MSSPAALSPPEPAAAEPAREPSPAPDEPPRRPSRAWGRWIRPQALVTLAVATALAAAAFAADGGMRLEPTTNTLIALIGASALLVAATIVLRPSGRLHGAAPLAAVAALAALTAASITWSIAPSDSWEEANRTFAYLAVFTGGMALARLAPWSWVGLLHGLALACVVVSAWALTTKVFPAALAPDEIYARLRSPFDYWNAVGLMAALGVPPLLWLAARRSGHSAANALAWPGLGVLLTTLMLSYSRGALIALLVGLAVWFAVVPLRLRSALALAAASVAAALPVTWAFTQPGLTRDHLPVAARSDAGAELGFLLVVMVLGLLAAGLAVGYAAARRPPSQRLRTLAGRAMLGGLAAIALAGVIALAAAPGGIDGQLSSAWDRISDPNAPTPANTPDRFTEASSVRARYWSEAFDVHATSAWLGTGAGGYPTGRTRFRDDTLEVRHAHGYVPQTLSDLGWAGLGVSLLALGLWLSAAARVTGSRRRDRGLPYDPERIGALALVVVVVVFGVHSFIDWTWFVPANAALAMLAAGWVAGRAPLRDRFAAGDREPAPEPVPAGAGRRQRLRRRLGDVRRNPLPAAAALTVLALAAAASWAAYQPVRAVHAGDAAIERIELGQLEAAESIARIAHDRNPLSVDPLWDLAVIQDLRGDRLGAAATLEEAAALQPANAEAWRRLGRYRLSELGEIDRALEAFRAAYYLDPGSPGAESDFLEVSRAMDQR